MSKSVHLYEMSEAMLEVLKNGGKISFTSAGFSMLPMLRNRLDSVVLQSPTRKLKKNDVIFYIRDNGSYVLHRIIGRNSDGFILRGDNQYETEYGIRENQIIAVLVSYKKNGKQIDCQKSVSYKFYCLFLPLIRFYRRRIYPIYAKLAQWIYYDIFKKTKS